MKKSYIIINNLIVNDNLICVQLSYVLILNNYIDIQIVRITFNKKKAASNSSVASHQGYQPLQD